MTDRDSLRLEEPQIKWLDSYRSLVREFVDREDRLIPFTLAFPNHDFQAFLEKLSACARGEELPVGFVPHSTFWLVRNNLEVVGVSNLRHALTDMLRRDGGAIGYGVRPSARLRGYASALLLCTLKRAREIGLSEVLLTCAKTNIGSVHTILRCGGVLESEEFLPDRSEIVQRYVIVLEHPA